MLRRKKSLIMLVCALIIISSVAFGTIAYLTDRAGVTNRFTIGNVDIVVDETEVDENGNPVPNPDHDPEDPTDPDNPFLRTEEENEYPLIPGSEYTKDPTMTIKAGSEEAYVRMMVTINNAKEVAEIFEDLKAKYPDQYPNGFVPGEYVTERDNETWIYTGSMVEDTVQNTYTLEFRYYGPVKPAGDADAVLPPLFKTIKFPGELTNEHLSKLTDFAVEVYGNAIQTKGFADADAAWSAFDAQANVTDNGSEQP